MQKLVQIFSLAVCLFLSFGAKAQNVTAGPVAVPVVLEEDPPVEEEGKGFSLSGFVDAYYQANFIAGEASDEPLLFPTSFTEQANGFTIGMVNLLAEHSFGKVSFVGQIGFGPRAVAASSDSNLPFGGTNFASTVQQLYVSYAPSDAVTLTMGNFGTFVGYEVIDATANVNYSTSYLFSNGPFYHTGLKADFTIAEGFGAMVGVFNDTDSKIDVIEGKHLGGQLSFETGGLGAYLNVLAGKEAEGDKPEESTDDLNEFQIDLTATYKVRDNLTIGLNASKYSTAVDGANLGGFFGTALYSTIGMTDGFALGLRAEYFVLNNPDDISSDEPNVLSLTASGNITIGNLRIIPEVRYDSGSNNFLFGGSLEDTAAASFILAAVYGF